jgi:hypothetical protein
MFKFTRTRTDMSTRTKAIVYLRNRIIDPHGHGKISDVGMHAAILASSNVFISLLFVGNVIGSADTANRNTECLYFLTSISSRTNSFDTGSRDDP